MNLAEAAKLLEVIKAKALAMEKNLRVCNESDSDYFMRQFGLIIDDEINCEYINGRLATENPEILVHNVNHYRVASPKLRLAKEFGLGIPPNAKYYESFDSENDPLLLTSKKVAQEEEILACALDLLCSISRKYSLDLISVILTTKDLQTIHSLGLITKTGKPTKKLRKGQGKPQD